MTGTTRRFLGVAAVLLVGMVAFAAGPDDEAAIKATALDYLEGWYSGDAERMERALHPDLAKRIVRVDPEGRWDHVDS
ncbi:MAG: nuclear transport factor 2 family protein [Acidobacteriota bacterium]|nr:nuclear transport factor 2 family protein [Acidobacteriota bacterium]